MRKVLYTLGLLLGTTALLVAQKAKISTQHFKLENQVDSLQTAGLYQQALPLAEKVVALAARELGEQDSVYAERISRLGILHYYLGNYSKSQEYMKGAADLFKDLLGKQSPKYSNGLINLAAVYERVQEYEEAEVVHTEIQRLLLESLGKEHVQYGYSLNNRAALYFRMERYEESARLFQQALLVWEKNYGQEHPLYAQTVNNLALVYRGMDDFVRAEQMYKQAIEIRRKQLGDSHPALAETLNSLGQLYRTQKKYEQARPLLEQARAIWKAAYGENHPRYAIVLRSVGGLYDDLEKPQKALPLFLQALEITAANFGEYDPNYITTLNNLGEHYYKQNKADSAIHYYTTSIQRNIQDNSWSPYQSENWQEVVLKNTITEYNQLMQALSFWYDLERERGRFAQAKDLGSLYMKVAQRYRQSFNSQNDKLRLLKKTHWMISRLVRDAAQQHLPTEQAFHFAEANKSILLADALKSTNAQSMGALPDSLIQRENQLKKALGKAQKALLEKKNTAEYPKVLDQYNELNQQFDQFSDTIKNDYKRYHQLNYANQSASIADIQAQLQPGEVFLEYFVTDSTVYLFKITSQTHRLLDLAVPEHQLKRKVADLRKALSDYQFIAKETKMARTLYQQTAYWCYKQLLQAALSDVDKGASLLIVTDGVLGHLPFEAFLTEAIDESLDYTQLPYLLRHYVVSYNYSATLWRESKQQPTRQHNGQMLAFAASYGENTALQGALNRSASTRNLRDALEDLPAVQEEVLALQNNLSGQFFFKEAANEKQFKTSAKDYGLIHLAMHGLLNKKHPILSSMAFTENGDSLEDNFLQAWEIAQLELQAELVVLSACETGYGKFQQGEGVMSLARSFMYAGVPSLVVSLWQVNDASTARIMENFYKELQAGKRKSVALQQAKLHYINEVKNPKAAHPAYWAAFIQLGDDRPLPFTQKGNWQGYLLWGGGAAVLLLGMGFLFFRRRNRQNT